MDQTIELGRQEQRLHKRATITGLNSISYLQNCTDLHITYGKHNMYADNRTFYYVYGGYQSKYDKLHTPMAWTPLKS